VRWPTGVVSNNRAYGVPGFDHPFFLGALLLTGSLAAPVVLSPNGGGVPGEIAPLLAGAQGAGERPRGGRVQPGGLAKEGRPKLNAGHAP